MDASSSNRPTQKDIARAAGVTQATVSLALRHHPAIKPETIALVHEAAGKLGYTPDPYLSGLSSYRKRIRPPEHRATLAWLSNDADGRTWKRSPVFTAYHEGALTRATELGYRLEDHCLHASDMNSTRLAAILRARNIPGILVAPQPEPNTRIDFPFEHFSAIAIGYSLVEPRLHLVTWHQFRAMETLFRKLLALGYRRPGLALMEESDERSDHNWSAAFWSEQRRLPAARQVPPLIKPQLSRDQFMRWFRRHHPDVVISLWLRIDDWLKEAGVSVPHDTGFASLSLAETNAPLSGLSENPRGIGAKAVEFVVDMIHRFETGVPRQQSCLLVEGIWSDGETLRHLPVSAPPPVG
ncbi:LacI family DNA-binding transcriptional regulator [Geminisphaera colitermitum]|uniref:LacI family DNA-binding transcriptional regulator n=1 Tax=Geminisphaera colitermitum TaxID=1148786 RepID=UPI000158D079